ncbi:MAG: hypothetical protein R3F14_17120 [Polyangiaceae bacterium]
MKGYDTTDGNKFFNLRGLAVDSTGNVVFAGTWVGDVSFGGATLSSATSACVRRQARPRRRSRLQPRLQRLRQSSRRAACSPWMALAVFSRGPERRDDRQHHPHARGRGRRIRPQAEPRRDARGKRFGDGERAQTAEHIAADGAGNVLLLGHFSGQIDFGGEGTLGLRSRALPSSRSSTLRQLGLEHDLTGANDVTYVDGPVATGIQGHVYLAGS